MNKDDAEVISGLVARSDALAFAVATLFGEVLDRDTVVAARLARELKACSTYPIHPRVAREVEALAQEWARLAHERGLEP